MNLTRSLLSNKKRAIYMDGRMNKKIAILLILILTATSLITLKPAHSENGSAPAENTWIERAPMPTAREALGLAVVNGKIYAIGGYASGTEFRDFPYGPCSFNEVYDPANDSWNALASMPTSRGEFGITVCQNKIYVIGGVIGSGPIVRTGEWVAIMTGVNEAYDPATDTWETKTPMPTERGKMQANTVDGKIYVAGGVNQTGIYGLENVMEVYDPENDSWTTMAPMPAAQADPSVVVDEKIFFIDEKVQIFDPKTDQWTTTGALSPLGIGVAGLTTGVMAPKRIYVFDRGSTSLTNIYNPEFDNWTLGAPKPTKFVEPRPTASLFSVAVVNDTLYAIGGGNANFLFADNYQYTPFGYGTLPELTPPSPTHLSSQEPKPFPTILVTGSIIAVAIIGAGFLVYSKKRKH
jgi:N-acetylneuraminic acid mutarotase